MTPVIYSIIVGLLMILAVSAALKLFDINSDYSPIIRKVSIPAAVILSLVLIVYSVPTIVNEEKYDNGTFALITAGSFVGLVSFGWIMSKIIGSIFNKRIKGKKKTKLAFAPLLIIDVLGGIIAGVAFSGCFFSSIICYLAAVALAFYLIIEKAAIVFRYQDEWPRNQIIADIAASLIAIPVTSTLIIWLVGERFEVLNILLAFGTGYILYRCVYHLFFIVKTMKKR